MAGLTPYYLLQSSFATGEISPEVANRVDLDKYNSAVLRARNCFIRPYGPIYRRPGMSFVSSAKYSDKKCILVPFNGGGNEDYLLEIGYKYIRVFKDGARIESVEITTPFLESDLTSLRFTQSADVMFIASGSYPVKQLARYSDTDWRFSDFEISDMYFDMNLISSNEDATITPSGKTGSVTLTASENLFTSDMVGMQIKLKQNVPAQEASATNATTSSLYCGEGWKIITHGTWTGTVELQRSYDNSTWESYRKYSAKDDYNVTESGSLSEPYYLRAICSITSGTVKISVSTMPYDKEGICQVTKYTSGTQVTATVLSDFGTTTPTKLYYWGAWCSKFGYPKTIAFFQDRLCFGGSKMQPYMIWMSRTGDYGNFSVEKASGSVTDDSAIAAGLVSRKQYQIKHLLASTDLIILTAGNEWIISGGDVVTPSNINAKMQTTRGCNDCEPIPVGGRIVFIQGRGSTVRDMGYSYETDGYGGADLTLLAKHIINNIQITDSTYKQEPDSTLYFVRSDGKVACLAYIYDQKVYAWSTVDTEGSIESIAAIQEGNEDVVYISVKRVINGTTYRYIEYINNNNSDSSDPDSYIMLDSAIKINASTRSSSFTCEHLKNATIDVLADDRVFKNINTDADGTFTLPTEATNIVAGLPYKTEIELPNVEIKAGDGTMQGRNKQISGCTLRLNNSLGGEVGNTSDLVDMIPYDENSAIYDLSLYSGDKKITLPIGGFNFEGRLFITSDEPFPFNLLMAVREVTFGG